MMMMMMVFVGEGGGGDDNNDDVIDDDGGGGGLGGGGGDGGVGDGPWRLNSFHDCPRKSEATCQQASQPRGGRSRGRTRPPSLPSPCACLGSLRSPNSC